MYIRFFLFSFAKVKGYEKAKRLKQLKDSQDRR